MGIFNIIEKLLALYGLYEFLKNIIKKIIFKNYFKYRDIINSMKSLSPNDKNSGVKIHLLDIPISQYNIKNLQNRYSKIDIEEYIHKLEQIKKSRILKCYLIDNLILKLYDMKQKLIDYPGSGSDFEIRMSCLCINKIIFDSINDPPYKRIFKLCQNII